MKKSRKKRIEGAAPSSSKAAGTERAGRVVPYVVGMGGSAGGLEAFEQFFSHLPPDTGLVFIVVPHLEPTHKGMMPELLARHTKMPVVEVEDGMKVQPNCVYVIPPNADLSILHGKLQVLEPVAPRGQRMAIDFFFRHLAADQKEKAIPQLLQDRPKGNPVRVWNPGCSTGAETYSLAIVLKECLEELKFQGGPTIQIFGTDLDKDAIDKARRGMFLAGIAADVSPKRLARFFDHEDEGYRIKKEVRDVVVFAMAREGLREELDAALHNATTRKTTVIRSRRAIAKTYVKIGFG